MGYIRWHNGTTGVTGLPTTQALYWKNPVANQPCEVDLAACTALTMADRLAQSVTSPTGLQARSCSTTPTADPWQIYDPGDGSNGFIAETITSTPVDPTPTTPGAEYVGGSSNPIIYTV